MSEDETREISNATAGKARPETPAPASCSLATEAVNSALPVEALERFSGTFERSVRRWEIIVYPSIVALIAMVGGAFFFIYSLTRDMRDLALQIQPQLGYNIDKVAASVYQLSSSLDQMSQNIDTMRVKMETMSGDVGSISTQMGYMKTMTEQMAAMNASMVAMTAQTDAIRWNMQTMNRSIGKPMAMFNSFMPW
jgi:methyl-accepting chemotaxis protein